MIADRLTLARDRHERAKQEHAEATENLRLAIDAAMEEGWSQTRIADVIGLSRQRVGHLHQRMVPKQTRKRRKRQTRRGTKQAPKSESRQKNEGF